MISFPIFLLWLLTILIFISNSQSLKGKYLIDCGGSGGQITKDGPEYTSDEGFISVGKTTTLNDQNDISLPILTTLRYFPDDGARKYCYVMAVEKGQKYLIRTTYFYGGFDGGDSPPVFDQVVDGTSWGPVDTAADYAEGLSSYYEVAVAAMGNDLSVCLARSERTAAGASPFISALEVDFIAPSLYNVTDFAKFGLRTVARTNFGGDTEYLGFPDDKFNRLWQSFKDQNPVVASQSKVNPSDFWNLPPDRAFSAGITTSRGKALQILWPPIPLPAAEYYVALYFQDNRTPSPYSWRLFDVSVNGKIFYANLNVTTKGTSVYSPRWPLAGQTVILMTPAMGTPVGPVINAGEVLQILPLGGHTLTSDEIAMNDLARSFNNPPLDWSGDPCLPKQNSWTGVSCSDYGNFARVVSLDLTAKGISGSLPSAIANLTAINHIWLGGNKLSGRIPEMGSLKELKTLHLDNNQFEGPIPSSLGQLPGLNEIFLQNNNLDRQIPTLLQNRSGQIIQV